MTLRRLALCFLIAAAFGALVLRAELADWSRR